MGNVHRPGRTRQGMERFGLVQPCPGIVLARGLPGSVLEPLPDYTRFADMFLSGAIDALVGARADP